MRTSISATRVATLVGDFDRSPAYAGLATALTRLIGDGRIALATRLPSERELTEALAVSRTTVTRAYAALRDAGYAEARQGAGTFTRVPGGRSRARDHALSPRAGDHDAIDLNCAATSAPPGIAEAYAAAAAEIPAYLGGHGYFPAGLPELQAAIAATYEARGLPTEPGQVLVTNGALSGISVAAQALVGAGDRVLVDSPAYPNATMAIRHSGARVVGSALDPDGWDLDAAAATLRQVAPRVAYLVPDFQNPTGLLMADAQRTAYAAALRRSGTVAIVDEAHQALALDGQPMPRPFAAYAPETLSVGSASKSFWGGLRLGWLRVPRGAEQRFTDTRIGLDLGAPVLEQLVLARLLEQGDTVVEANRVRLREQRDALVAAVSTRLPEWRFHRPGGGLALWCELPEGSSGTALATEAERHGVIVAPGPAFAPEGGLDRFVRIPWTRPPAELRDAVDRLALAWDTDRVRTARRPGARGRVMVA